MGGRTAAIAAAAATAVALGASALGAAPAAAALSQLTRYPYLTDAVNAGSTVNATVNFATDQTVTTAYATMGVAGGSCNTTRKTGSKTGITVNGVAENQWKVKFTGLTPGTQYCYRVLSGSPTVPGPDLLGTDPSPVFATPPAPGSTSTFKFAVLGDWGFTNSSGTNPDQANLDAQIASSGALFAVGTGDTAYPGGSQTNYGDLNQVGANISDVFAPNFYKTIGDGIPMYNALGNHGQSATFLNTWPQPTAPVLSNGRSQTDTYCCVNGTNSASYPSVWYAFDVGRARIYILDAAWANSNLGTGTIYSDDNAAHWQPSDPEYQWLASDLAAHPGALKIAVMHLPMYADNPTEGTDPYMHGPGSVAALLSQYGVQMVLNGHMHAYERNTKQPGESFVSYVTGGGGATLEPVGSGTAHCGSYDAYAVGWSPTKLKGYACGAAAPPTSASQVYHFLLVTVGSSSVTVMPTDELGRTFDVQTYGF
jgi:Calcineurin-like phosphoesterase/Purple acid Phosphatase, N-terminal domain